ncbi:MAG: type II toxin-antitoxin system HicB family antitoxin [Clostridia bacterium]|nr:type II toxin-antitoxin system HicB family antitoxin [Clostridia bacterium]
MGLDRYIFPAIFTYAEDGISIEFPDLPGCLPCANSTEEALGNARQALGLHLYGMEQDGDDIPSPTPVEMIRTGEKQVLMLVDTWMLLIRDAIESRAVKKTLTIPAWLNTMAESNNVNFSQVLQSALKERLGVVEPR